MTLLTADEQVKRTAAKYMRVVLDQLDEIKLLEDLESFETRPTDVVVTTFPKAGTVLMQQMVYQIAVLSGGASEDDPTGMEFEDIVLAVPWIELRKQMRYPDSKTFPRVMKTHFPVAAFKEGSCKHIVVIRNPESFPASFLNFLFFPINPDATDLPKAVYEECMRLMASDGLLKIDADRKDKLPAWHANVKDCVFPSRKNALVLFYEDIVKDLSSTVKRVARFMECKLSTADVDVVVNRCDQDYMAKDKKFHGLYDQKVLNTPTHVTCTKPKGFVGFKRFPVEPSIVKSIEKFNLKVFGVKTYGEIRQKLSTEQLSLHGY